MALRPLLPKLGGKALFGDKIYADKPLNERLQHRQDTYIYTPIKLIKGQAEWERQHNKAADDLFSRTVSAMRQPIESFFNWVHEKTQTQLASKVRSEAGLLVHVFGRLAAAYCLLASYT